MIDLIKRYSGLYFVEILGVCIMGNHFHLLLKMLPEYKFTDEEIDKRFVEFYGDDRIFADGLIPSLRTKLSSLSEFVREIKVIGDRIIEKERKREFQLSRSDRFRYRTRYFTDSGVIGSKEFVSKTYIRFKHHFRMGSILNTPLVSEYPFELFPKRDRDRCCHIHGSERFSSQLFCTKESESIGS
jgi:hypothetical protein